MLLLLNKYGLSHVCALQEFQDIGPVSSDLSILNFIMPYNFPFLDIYLSDTPFNTKLAIEFYYRGTRDKNLAFKNLFEYLLSTAVDGQG